MMHHSRSKYRVWLRIYVWPYTMRGYKHFMFRLNSKNWRPFVDRVRRWGYRVNAVYYEAHHRKTKEVISERLL